MTGIRWGYVKRRDDCDDDLGTVVGETPHFVVEGRVGKEGRNSVTYGLDTEVEPVSLPFSC